MKIIYAVIIAVAVINTPGAREIVGTIFGCQHIVVTKSETIVIKMIGFILAGVYEGSDMPGAGFYGVLDTRGGVIIIG